MLLQLINKCISQKDIPGRIVHTADWLGGHDNATAVVIPGRFEFVDKYEQNDFMRIKVFGISKEIDFAITKMDFKDISLFEATKPVNQLGFIFPGKEGRERGDKKKSEFPQKTKRQRGKKLDEKIVKLAKKSNRKEVEATLDFISTGNKNDEPIQKD